MTIHKKEDPRAIRSKVVLKQAVIDLLSNDTAISKLTVKNISECAGLNRATFYLHFKDVDDLLRTLVYEIVEELSVKMHLFFQDKNKSSSEKLTTFLDYFYQKRKLFSVLFELPRFNRKLHTSFRDALIENDTQVVKNLKFKHTSNDIIIASLLGTIKWWITEGTHHSSEYITQELLKMYN